MCLTEALFVVAIADSLHLLSSSASLARGEVGIVLSGRTSHRVNNRQPPFTLPEHAEKQLHPTLGRLCRGRMNISNYMIEEG